MTGFVGVADMVRWVTHHGVERLTAQMAEYIEADFRRWLSFDKTERVASHTAVS